MSELVKVDPKEYGLEPQSVKTIEDAFTPKIIERDALVSVYEELIKKELSPELCNEASDLRKKLVKVRTGISGIHKTQKAFFLSAGRFVDAWKNKETLPVTQMEDKLTEIEMHFENIERERLEKLQEKRVKQLSKYIPDAHERSLSGMDDDVWDAYLTAKKNEYNDRVAAEEKAEADRLEKIRMDKIKDDRRVELAPYVAFLDDVSLTLELEDEFYKLALDKAKADKKAEDERLKAIEDENERLRLESEKKEQERIEAEAKAKKEKEEAEAEAQRKLEAEKQKAEAERKKAQEESDRKIKAEKEKAEKIQAELQAKKDAEAKAEQERIEKQEQELNKGDADKVKDLISELESIQTKYQFKSKKNQKMYKDTGSLLDKVINHIKK